MRPIKRSQPTSDASPPWAGMKFTQPVDSDALHELLKEQYPQCKTLRQRKHMAAIDFLRLELESMQHESIESTTGTSYETQALSALDASRPGVEELAALTHRRSVSPSLSRSSSYRSPVHLDDHIPQIGVGQQHVFSIVDGFATQPKKKRKMTPAERSAYKTTRKVGACDKCKRQKGKCTHVIGKLVSMAKPLQEEKAVSQRLGATLPESMTAFNAEEPARTHQQTQELSQQQRTPLRTTPTTQSNTVPGSPQWTQEVHGMQEDSQSGMSGYVTSHMTGPYTEAPQTSQDDQWSNQTSFVEPQTFQANHCGYNNPLDQNGAPSSFSTFPGLSPREVQYPPNLFDPSWNQSMDYLSGEANPR